MDAFEFDLHNDPVVHRGCGSNGTVDVISDPDYVVRRKKRIYLWVPLGSVGSAIFIGMWLWHAWSPAAVFKSEFGFKPPADVLDIKSSTWALGDSGYAYLKFQAAPSTVAQIKQSQGLASPTTNFSTNTRPDWWIPIGIESAKDSSNGSFASEHRELWYDQASGQVWYEYSGVD